MSAQSSVLQAYMIACNKDSEISSRMVLNAIILITNNASIKSGRNGLINTFINCISDSTITIVDSSDCII